MCHDVGVSTLHHDTDHVHNITQVFSLKRNNRDSFREVSKFQNRYISGRFAVFITLNCLNNADDKFLAAPCPRQRGHVTACDLAADFP